MRKSQQRATKLNQYQKSLVLSNVGVNVVMTKTVVNMQAFETTNGNNARRVLVGEEKYMYNIYFNKFGDIVGFDEWDYKIPGFNKLSEILSPEIKMEDLIKYELKEVLEGAKNKDEICMQGTEFLTWEDVETSQEYQALPDVIKICTFKMEDRLVDIRDAAGEEYHVLDQRYLASMRSSSFIGSDAEQRILKAQRELDRIWDDAQASLNELAEFRHSLMETAGGYECYI